ncbi:O-antigen ligase family protein, partial [bacterium]|nr:O-antigen ligase family protein [candidate division CSSED10-310 bacterium]
RGRRTFILGVAAATLLVVVPFIVSNPSIGERFSLMARFKTDSVGARVFYWRVMLDMIRDRPVLGFGLGTFKFHYYDYQCRLLDHGTSLRAYTNQLVFQAHNEYLQALVETGLIGLGSGLFLMVLLIRRGLRGIARSTCDQERGIRIGMLVGFFMVLFNALFSFPFHVASTGLLTALFAGIALTEPWSRGAGGTHIQD